MTIRLDMALEKLHLRTFVMQQKIQNAQLKISCFMVPVVTAVLSLKGRKCPTCSIAPLTYIILYHLFPWIRTGLQIHMDMENGHINTKCTKHLQYMVHKLFDIIK